MQRTDSETKELIKRLVNNTDSTLYDEPFIEYAVEELEITREKYFSLIK